MKPLLLSAVAAALAMPASVAAAPTHRDISYASTRRHLWPPTTGSTTTSHLDPLTAAPQTNDFLDTVVPFLKDAVR